MNKDKKYRERLTTELTFEEALRKISQADKKQVDEAMKKDAKTRANKTRN